MSQRPAQYFRAGVGAVILRGQEVLSFERVGSAGSWQFPQGGIDEGETPLEAVWREVREETGLTETHLTLLYRFPGVLGYTLPADKQTSKTGLGQCHYWFYFQFTGEDGQIRPDADEFGAFRWTSMRTAMTDVHAMRREAYRALSRGLPAAQRDLPHESDGQPVSLRPIDDSKALEAVAWLAVAPHQRGFVADNASSICQALLEPKSWLRAIYAGETAVGLILLADDPKKPEYFLWRLLIGARFQRRGYGRAAVEQLVEYVRSRPSATELLVSYVPGEAGPQRFYEGIGFVPTGEIDDGEVVMRLTL